jgi:hypothetical protein
MAGTYTTDEIRAVRLNIPDTDAIYGDSEDEYLFSDEDVAILLDQAQGNAMWAAGIAMIAVGNSEAMIGKVIRNYETETDASKLQREWRSAGVEMIKIGKSLIDSGEGFFDVVYPEWGSTRHPEGELHGSFRIVPSPYQW